MTASHEPSYDNLPACQLANEKAPFLKKKGAILLDIDGGSFGNAGQMLGGSFTSTFFCQTGCFLPGLLRIPPDQNHTHDHQQPSGPLQPSGMFSQYRDRQH